MFYTSYTWNGKSGWGIAYPDMGIIYSAQVFIGEHAPKTLLEFIRDEDMHASVSNGPIHDNPLPLNSVNITAPIPNPLRNIYCVGRNYLDHIKELNNMVDLPKEYIYPNFFTKATKAVNGPFDPIPEHRNITTEIDYEAELAIVIGKAGANIAEGHAMDYVFGYTILNDVTARDLQRNHFQWFKGKSLDGFCPMGPWIASKDKIPNPDALDISSFVNNERRQHSNTSKMIFPLSKLISILSEGHTLLPGDIIATGTPSGVGKGFDPPRLLTKGDKVRCEIQGIGFIENLIG